MQKNKEGFLGGIFFRPAQDGVFENVGNTRAVLGRSAEGHAKDLVFVVVGDGHYLGACGIVPVETGSAVDLGHAALFDKCKFRIQENLLGSRALAHATSIRKWAPISDVRFVGSGRFLPTIGRSVHRTEKAQRHRLKDWFGAALQAKEKTRRLSSGLERGEMKKREEEACWFRMSGWACICSLCSRLAGYGRCSGLGCGGVPWAVTPPPEEKHGRLQPPGRRSESVWMMRRSVGSVKADSG